MKLEFSGAARQVTGSKHLLHINGKKILLDCGLFQGHRKKAAMANMRFPFDVKDIDAVVLSHAHIDHSGTLPVIAKLGYTGPVYSTHATKDLCGIMLRDAGHIQEQDAEWIAKKLGLQKAEPLYTQEDAAKIVQHFEGVNYGESFSPCEGVHVRFHDAGHVLGSAVEEWEIHDQETGQDIRLGFTGDLGRHDLPILRDPSQLEGLDVLITESTYGDRLHDEIADVEDKFAASVIDTMQRGGKIIIPAFALERTQEILYVIRELQQAKKLPELKIYVDSPLATSATEIFRRHPECYDQELRDLMNNGQDPFCPQCDGLRFTQSVEESKALNDQAGPMIIISASGMCEAGRIRHHLKNNIPNPNNKVLIVGFMAQNTLGRKIVDKDSPINIYGKPYEMRADVEIYNAFSGHADQKGLLNFAHNSGAPKSVFCVHGEEMQMETFTGELAKLDNLKGAGIHMPEPGEIYELTQDKKMQKTSEVNLVSQSLCCLE